MAPTYLECLSALRARCWLVPCAQAAWLQGRISPLANLYLVEKRSKDGLTGYVTTYCNLQDATNKIKLFTYRPLNADFLWLMFKFLFKYKAFFVFYSLPIIFLVPTVPMTSKALVSKKCLSFRFRIWNMIKSTRISKKIRTGTDYVTFCIKPTKSKHWDFIGTAVASRWIIANCVCNVGGEYAENRRLPLIFRWKNSQILKKFSIFAL